MHANDARWDATSTHHDDFDPARLRENGSYSPHYGVQAKRAVAQGRTCGGTAGLGAAGESEYVARYQQHHAPVRLLGCTRSALQPRARMLRLCCVC